MLIVLRNISYICTLLDCPGIKDIQFMDQGFCVLINWRYFDLGGSTAGTAVLPPSAFSQAVVPPVR